MSKLTKQLQRLFPDFRNYKAKFLNPNTIDVYDDYLKLINTFPNHLDKPSEIRDWLLKRYSAEYSRRILQHIEACYNWAVGSDMAKENPFTKMPNLPKTAYNRREAFSLADRDHIIETFKHENPYWEPFVWFLFKTGCRFEEAVGLQVRHIGPECKFIRFEQAIAASGRVTPIKTGVKRKFPCNDRMQKRLRFITCRFVVVPYLHRGTHYRLKLSLPSLETLGLGLKLPRSDRRIPSPVAYPAYIHYPCNGKRNECSGRIKAGRQPS
jgi:integrase